MRYSDDVTFYAFLLLFTIVVLGLGCAAPRVPDRLVDPVAEMLASVERATVLIDAHNSCGSGVLIGTNTVLTVAHVVEHEGERFEVVFPDGKKFPGYVSRVDKKHDLAVVGFYGHAETPWVRVATRSPALMASVWNLGAPMCQPGHVSRAFWSRLDEDGARILSGGFLWPGMSGGPVVNAAGELVALNDAVIQLSDHTVVPQMGLVVDYAEMKRFLQ